MKIRIFKKLVDGVFDVRIMTEDWSQNDIELMVKLGEPEINLGGVIVNTDESSSTVGSSESSGYIIRLNDIYARIMSESPFTQKFDSRDYGTVENAKAVADAWVSKIEERLLAVISSLRSQDKFFTTEEVVEY